MIIDLTIGIAIPLAFWMFDVFGKMASGIKADDMGADLCLLGASFAGTTFLFSLFSAALEITAETQGLIDRMTAIAMGALLISLIAYMFSLVLIADGGSRSFPRMIRALRAEPFNVVITVALGFLVVLVQITFYVSTFRLY